MILRRLGVRHGKDSEWKEEVLVNSLISLSTMPWNCPGSGSLSLCITLVSLAANSSMLCFGENRILQLRPQRERERKSPFVALHKAKNFYGDQQSCYNVERFVAKFSRTISRFLK